jgi:hypothetical protein
LGYSRCYRRGRGNTRPGCCRRWTWCTAWHSRICRSGRSRPRCSCHRSHRSRHCRRPFRCSQQCNDRLTVLSVDPAAGSSVVSACSSGGPLDPQLRRQSRGADQTRPRQHRTACRARAAENGRSVREPVQENRNDLRPWPGSSGRSTRWGPRSWLSSPASRAG